MVRLDLTREEQNDLDQMDVYRQKIWDGKCGGRARGGWGGSRAKWAEKAEKRAQWSKKKTAKRGRIDILPLNGAGKLKDGEVIDHKPVPMLEKEAYLATVREI